MVLFSNPPELIALGDIECTHVINNNSNQTSCVLKSAYYPDFEIDIANISSNRIYGESENGNRIEILRLSSDLCWINNTEDCVNTGIFDYLNDGDL
jgi:hypothetical protein